MQSNISFVKNINNMEIPLLETSLPEHKNVTGRFCFPEPITFNGTFTSSANQGSITSIVQETEGIATVVQTDHGYNTEDIVEILGADQPEYNGFKKITVVDEDTYTYFVGGSPASEATGTMIARKNKTLATGTGTLAGKNFKVGDYLYSPQADQCRKVVEIVDAETWYFDKPFDSDPADEIVAVPSGGMRGISIKCGGPGTIQGEAVATNDVITFSWDNGLSPVAGNAGSNTYNLILQK